MQQGDFMYLNKNIYFKNVDLAQVAMIKLLKLSKLTNGRLVFIYLV